MQKKREKSKFNITVCGEFFPETYPVLQSKKWSRGGEDPLATEMRIFCACQRWAFNRLQEGVSRKEIKKQGQELFGLNSRYVDDARLKAQALLDSQKELLELKIKETTKKLGRAKKKLSQAMRKLAKAEKKDAALNVIANLRLTVKGRSSRVYSLEKKLLELEAHQKNKTVPRVVFGGRSLWKKVCSGRASREEWQAVRKNRLYSRGDETKGGNPNIKILSTGQDFHLAVTISHLSEQIGTDKLGRPIMSRAPKVEGKLWLPEKHRDLVKIWLAERLPYTVELIRTLEGRYLVHLTFDPGGIQQPNFTRGCLSLDINPDGLALCNVSAIGQPELWPEGFSIPHPDNLGKYKSEFQVITYPNGFIYIRIPDLAYASGFRRSYLIGVLARVVVDVALFLGKPIALENLSFSKDRLDTSRGFNRMASNFPFAKMTEAVCRRASKEKVSFKPVPARHTSTIGFWKYMERYAVPVHCAAALVTGRRAIGFKERITKELKQRTAEIKQNLAQKVNPDIPKEGEGMTHRVGACLRRLDEKLPLHNGFAPWQQEAYYSVWRDLKLLALSLR